MKDVKKYLVTRDDSIKKVLAVIDRNKDGIALVVDVGNKLVGTITDGDIRRYLLKKGNLNTCCGNIMASKPYVVEERAKPKDILEMLEKNRLRNIPMVDKAGKVIRIVHLRDITSEKDKKDKVAVIMAGGEGKRLRPLTSKIPKPMIEIGEKPILEHIIRKLAQSDFKKIFITLNYRGKIIENYFGNGDKFGVNITYIKEKRKLGTAGALSLIPDILTDSLLVMNGDLITKVNFQNMLNFHKRHHAMMCIGAMEYHLEIPYGVLNLAEHYVLGIKEKPSERFLCNAGIYLIEPDLLKFIPADEIFHMTDLLDRVVMEGLPVVGFPIHEYWVDIGQKKDLLKANNELKIGNGKKERKKL